MENTDTSISQPESGQSLDPVDEIAQLLSGDESEDTTEEPEAVQQALAEEEPSEEIPESEESEEDQPDDSQETDEESDESIAALLGLADDQVIADDDGNLSFVTKINGKVNHVPLQDLVAGYQYNKANEEKAHTLSNERKAFDEQRAAEFERLKTSMDQAEGLVMVMHNEAMRDYEATKWDELRQYDPGEYAAKQADFQRRQQELQQASTYIQSMRNEQAEKLQAEREESIGRIVAEQMGIMVDNNPDWRDDNVRQKAMKELQDFTVEQYGFDPNEFYQNRDARVVEIVKDAMAYRKGLKVASKKRKAPPKLQRAKNGQFKSGKVSKLDKLTRAIGKSKGHNKRDLQAAAVAELLTGGQ